MALSRATHTVAALFLASLPLAGAAADVVKVTPLGSHDGELCRHDVAMVFEDPTGTRILYDAGRTVAGPDDPRLGEIDIILVSHMHGNHVGDRHISSVGSGNCAEPDMSVRVTPNTNTVNIALEKKALIVTGSEMPRFFARKLQSLGGDATKSRMVGFGASRTIRNVTITTVPATHPNGVDPAYIGGTLGELMREAGLRGYVGPATGYVLTFSNGLVVYLSGDTGVTSEHRTVVAEQYDAELVVMNIADTFTTGPDAAAFAVNELIKPTSVIPSRVNEVATARGEVLEGTRTERFKELVDADVIVPLSGKTFGFDDDGNCVEGC